eukprot:NODE_242_length_11906_cov_0.577454.p3 type:complete len:187 gc:universal NODE_242_length_11906_cov_0.577454:6240-5680(-)
MTRGDFDLEDPPRLRQFSRIINSSFSHLNRETNSHFTIHCKPNNTYAYYDMRKHKRFILANVPPDICAKSLRRYLWGRFKGSAHYFDEMRSIYNGDFIEIICKKKYLPKIIKIFSKLKNRYSNMQFVGIDEFYWMSVIKQHPDIVKCEIQRLKDSAEELYYNLRMSKQENITNSVMFVHFDAIKHC